MFESDVQLSPAGAERRERILELAKGQARGRRRRRTGVRVGVSGVVVLLVGFLIWPSRPTFQVIVKLPVSNPPVQSVGLAVTFIQTDPTIADRLAVSPPARWSVIDDDQLLKSLADAGHPAGLISMNGRTFLLPR